MHAAPGGVGGSDGFAGEEGHGGEAGGFEGEPMQEYAGLTNSHKPVDQTASPYRGTTRTSSTFTKPSPFSVWCPSSHGPADTP